MNNFFTEALQLLEKRRGGKELTQEEQASLEAAFMVLDHTFDDIPVDEGLKKLAALLETPPDDAGRKSWLVGGDNGGFPLTAAVRVDDGRIAELVKAARKTYRCRCCSHLIEPQEPYYKIFWAGAGLGDIKFPARVHVACLPRHLGLQASPEDMKRLWGLMFDYGYANCASLTKRNRLPGYVAGMQRIWNSYREAERRQASAPFPGGVNPIQRIALSGRR